MGHLTSRNAYKNLEDVLTGLHRERLRFQGPCIRFCRCSIRKRRPSGSLFFRCAPLRRKKAAKIWNTSEAKAEKFLTHLCEKALLVDSYHNGGAQIRDAASYGRLY